ncbi:MAG: amidase [Acidobacteria bacterium]|nr:amidase [Acidobacteriota bacterium]
MNDQPQTIAALGRALAARETTAQQATEQCLQAIATRSASLNAFTRVLADAALEAARRADAEIAAGRRRGLLHGVPISLKDVIDMRGVATTAASRVREDHVAAADATSVGRLREAGAVIVGKTNLHEFAFGTTSEESAFGPARHPLDPTRSPGGSSGGSAASVLAGMAYGSIGTDTGGSIRIPAAACGLVGFKPTLGVLPTDGVVPLSTTMDHLGPICRSVEDAQLLFDVLRGAPPAAPIPRDARRMRLALLGPYFMALLDAGVADAFEGACGRLRSAGVELVEASIPHAGDIVPIYLHIGLSEAAAYHAATLDRCPDAYTPNVRLRLEMGRYILAEDYVRALRGRDVLTAEVDAALTGVDALLLPSLAIPAPKIGVETVRIGGADEPVRNVMLRLTQLFNITGHPSLTIPCGLTAEKLPVGAQIVGRRGDDAELLSLASALEPHLGPGASR